MEKLFIPESCVMAGASMVIRNDGDVEIINKLVPASIISEKGSILYRNGEVAVNCGEIKAENGALTLETGPLNCETISADSARIQCGDLAVSESLTVRGDLAIEAGSVTLNLCQGGNVTIVADRIELDTLEAEGDVVLQAAEIIATTIRGRSISVTGSLQVKQVTADDLVKVEQGKVSIKSLDCPRFEATPEVNGIVVMATCEVVKAEGVRGFLHPNELENIGLDAPRQEPRSAVKIAPRFVAAAPEPLPEEPVAEQPEGAQWAFAGPPEDAAEPELPAAPDTDADEPPIKAEETAEQDREVAAWTTRRLTENDSFTDTGDKQDSVLDDTFPTAEESEADEMMVAPDNEPDDDDEAEQISSADILDGPDLVDAQEETGPASDILETTGYDTDPDNDSDILNPSGAYAVIDSGSDILDHPGAIDEEDLPAPTPWDIDTSTPDEDPPVVQSGFTSATPSEEIVISTEDFSDVEELEEIESLEPLDVEEEDLAVSSPDLSEDDTDLLSQDDTPLDVTDQILAGDDLDEARDALEDSLDSDENVLDEAEEDILEMPAEADEIVTEEVSELPDEEVEELDDALLVEEVDSEDGDSEERVIRDLGKILDDIQAYFPEDNYPQFINQIHRYLEERRLSLFSKSTNKKAVLSSFNKFNHAEITKLAVQFFDRLDTYFADQEP